MNHSYKKMLATVLCILMLITCIAIPIANAATIYKPKATFTCTTMNDKIKWFAGRKSTVTISNTAMMGCGSLTVKASGSNCTVSPASATIKAGYSRTFTIKTPFAKVGTAKFNIVNNAGEPIRYTIKSSGTQTIVRTN